MSSSAVPLCPACHSPAAAWEIESPVRAVDRVIVDPSGMRQLGLHAPGDGLEPVDRPDIRCVTCRVPATESALRDAVLTAASAATRGESPRFDA